MTSFRAIPRVSRPLFRHALSSYGCRCISGAKGGSSCRKNQVSWPQSRMVRYLITKDRMISTASIAAAAMAIRFRSV